AHEARPCLGIAAGQLTHDRRQVFKMPGGPTKLWVHVRLVGGRSHDGHRDFCACEQIALAREQIRGPSYNLAVRGLETDVSSATRKNQENHLGIRRTWLP